MGLEIERKFLLKNDNWKVVADEGTVIKQGYLNTDKHRTVRVRIKGKQGFLTIKGKSDNITRVEFEYEIPLQDAEQLLLLCDKAQIEKIRYTIKINNHLWEIDEFDGANKGLIVAEIELKSEEENYEIPNWLGKEVSGDIKYYNSNLIKYPFQEWG